MTGPYTGSLLSKLLTSADGAKAKWVLREALSRLPADRNEGGVFVPTGRSGRAVGRENPHSSLAGCLLPIPPDCRRETQVGLLHLCGWKINSMKSNLSGLLMISRRILPSRTSVSLAAMTSICQFIASSVCGLRSWKQRAAKVPKSCRSSASYSARVRFSIIGLRFRAVEPRLSCSMTFSSDQCTDAEQCCEAYRRKREKQKV